MVTIEHKITLPATGVFTFDPVNARMGINTSSPQSILHILASGTPGSPVVDALSVVIQNSATAGAGAALDLISGNTGTAIIRLGDTDDEDAGAIAYNHNTNTMYFRSNALYRLKLDKDGNFSIGDAAAGTNATYVLVLSTGVAPTSSPANRCQMYSADIVAGNAAPHFRTEAGKIIKLYQQANIGDPSGGGVQDAEARTAINAILDILENTGLMAA